MDEPDHEEVKAAEVAIRKILIDLANETGRGISHVNVDTRNFANCAVEIFLES